MGQALRKVRGALVLLPAVVLAMPTGVEAQALGFGVTKPFIDNTELLNTGWEISYTRPVGSHGLEVRLPFGMGRPEGGDGQFALGNPYIGLSMAGNGSMNYFGGVNLPLAPNDLDKLAAVEVIGASDATDVGAMVDYLTVTAGVTSAQVVDASAMTTFWGVAPQLAIFTGEDDGRDGTEINLRGWGGINYPTESVNLNAGAKVGYWVTQGDVGGDAAQFAIFGGGSTAAGPGTLGVSLTLPLSGDWSDAVSAALGVTYSLPLN